TGGQPEVELAVNILRQTTADMFHRMVKHGGRGESFFENAVGLTKAVFNITPHQAVFEQEVRAPLLMKNRRAGGESFHGVEQWRQRFILDANLVQRALGRAQILGDYSREQFSLEPDLVDSDKVLIVGEFKMLMGRQFEPRVLAIKVLPIQDRQNTRRFFSVTRVDA